MNVKQLAAQVNWPVMSARLMILAGLFTAGGELAGVVPAHYAAPVYAVAGAIVSVLPKVQSAANILRPDNSPVPSVRETLDAGKAAAEAQAAENAAAALLANPVAVQKIAGAVKELTNMAGFTAGELGHAAPVAALTPTPLVTAPLSPTTEVK